MMPDILLAILNEIGHKRICDVYMKKLDCGSYGTECRMCPLGTEKGFNNAIEALRERTSTEKSGQEEDDHE